VRLRFDQIAAIDDLVHRAERAAVSPSHGLVELARIESMRPSLPRSVRVAGHALLTAGLALLLQPTLGGLVTALGLGLLVRCARAPTSGDPDLIFPVGAAFIVR